MKLRERVNSSGKTAYFIDDYVGGKRVRETIGTNRQQAELALKKREVLKFENRYLDVRRSTKITFGELAALFLTSSKGENTEKTYDSYRHLLGPMERYFGSDRLIDSIQYEDVKRLQAHLRNGRSSATVNRYLAALRNMFNRAIDGEVIEKNPVKRVRFGKEAPNRLRFLERKEYDLLLAYCPQHLKSIVPTAAYTGMRYGELTNLTWAAVNLENGIITVRQSKSGRSRPIPISTALREILQAIPRSLASPYVFQYLKRRRNDSKHTDPRPIGSVKTSFKTALKRAGISDFHFHDLRHTFASWSVMMGMDLRTLAELLGHSSLKMVMKYAHLSNRHMRDAIERTARYGNGQETGNGEIALAATS